jgi:hypothetical protein
MKVASPVLNGEVAETDRKAPRRDLTQQPGAVKAASPVLNGGDEETCASNAPCPYPTQQSGVRHGCFAARTGDGGERCDRHTAVGARGPPSRAVRGEATTGHKVMEVRVGLEGPAPRRQDPSATRQGRPHEALVVGPPLAGRCRGLPQGVVREAWMRSEEGAEPLRDRQGAKAGRPDVTSPSRTVAGSTYVPRKNGEWIRRPILRTFVAGRWDTASANGPKFCSRCVPSPARYPRTFVVHLRKCSVLAVHRTRRGSGGQRRRQRLAERQIKRNRDGSGHVAPWHGRSP